MSFLSITTIIDKLVMTHLSFWNNSGILFTVFSIIFIFCSLRKGTIKSIFEFDKLLPIIAGVLES